ncbi:NUDIX hydrolase [Terriglobus albidus]|uniref:GDP-mannose pyrophosphatase n=1 Tax=Terriglobus albidus TaxID=1592106 RepID=A0A5B9E7G6_9BACT|nr:NUDIX hydrolase [Terriglobus albidus]QEE27709.1 NUDIX hydrolase [Terriglobus albidus]
MATKTSAKRTPAKKAPARRSGKAKLLEQKLAYDGPLFKVWSETVEEPGGIVSNREIIRHNGSVVILAVDDRQSKRDPYIIMERQYRQAAQQFLLELPAGRREADEKPLAAAKREMIEETGYRARTWKKLVRYYASPGFLGEWMEIYLATNLTDGEAQPEDDEKIEILRIRLSELLKMRNEGQIHDGKTIIGISIYEALRRTGKA